MGRRPNLKWLRGVERERDTTNHKLWAISFAVVALVVIAFFIQPFIHLPTTKPDLPLPDFKAIGSVSERKEAFFGFLGPLVTEINGRLLEQRAEVKTLHSYFLNKGKLSDGRLEKLNKLLDEYKFEKVETPDNETFKDLLSRIDIIPPSMALAQAAVESGWGTSRFAREGNNLFGMWCYKPGCGIVPARRPAGAKHEVTKYRSPRESFEAYIHNLNTNNAYVAVRSIRRDLRAADAEITGEDLARGLVKYSTQRWEYVRKIQLMIISNKLAKYDSISVE